MQFEDKYQAAVAAAATKPEEAIATLQGMLHTEVDADDTDAILLKEKAVYKLGDIYARLKRPDDVAALLVAVRPFFAQLPKAKTAKIVRKLCEQNMLAGASHDAQAQVCNDMIDWARAEKQTFLRHRLQRTLATVLHQKGDPAAALAVVNPLLREVRRLEDRALLVDIHLLESQIYYSIKSHAKARASLVAARTNANSIYCPPLQQAEIDMQSGVLHAEERDYKTAFSYLYEAFEGYHNLGDHFREARQALRQMILTKVLCDVPDELRVVLTAKSVLEYKGRDMDAMRAVAEAYRLKDTHMFTQIRSDYADELEDTFTQRHLTDMYDRLLEGHLLRLIEPYHRVQLEYLAESLKLDAGLVESRLSQMILDKKLRGIVDQQHRCLIVFEEEHPTKLYESAITTLDSMDKLVTALFDKVAGKFDHLAKKDDDDKKKKNKKDDKADGKGAKESTNKK
uniref:Probable 26S proteasome regulatory subunit rpn-6.2 n=1 Tax=Neobodo designis TaxID=312471 RepID=A0A7S1Q4M3_NEODS|mmetsp:Transcript_31384/g.96945  ORF Transcript_31384/g.96945 Transcript_31384/m.96945 type:complete len:454 (+) Transcript_31384:56-1417(+)